MPAIQVNQVCKSFEEISALQDISFEVKESEIFGLIGPDGAGKTTLIRILTSLLVPDSGTCRVLGLDPTRDYRQLRPKLGYMPGRFSLYQDLTILENITLFASIFETTLEQNYDLIRDIYVQIEPFKHRKAGQLSGGMKQKLALCCAMIHRPEILFLDEPTTGVDPVSRREFWEMLQKLNAGGLTILASTPYMDEASRCHTIALMQEGRVMATDATSEIIRMGQQFIYSISGTDLFHVMEKLKEYPTCQSVFSFGSELHYTDSQGRIDRAELNTFLEEAGFQDLVIQEGQPGIEDTFMHLMARQ